MIDNIMANSSPLLPNSNNLRQLTAFYIIVIVIIIVTITITTSSGLRGVMISQLIKQTNHI